MKNPPLSQFQLAREEQTRQLDSTLPSHAFSDDVRRAIYKFALIRNSWGTTNIDAGPIELARVAELYEAYEAGITPAGRVLPSEVEVLNYFGLVSELPTTRVEIHLEDLRRLHRDYFRDVPLHNNATPGQWKAVNNVVIGPLGRLTTTLVEHVERDLGALLTWLNGPGWELPQVTRGALFFHEFQRIHPFGDGNGRLGRLATLLVLRTGGLPSITSCPIDDAINDDRDKYYRALRAADGGDVDSWVSWFGSAVLNGYRRAERLATRLQAVPSTVPTESQRLLEWAYIHRVQTFRTADVKKFFLGLSKPTITRRLHELEELGLITGTGRGAGRAYRIASLHEVQTRGNGS